MRKNITSLILLIAAMLVPVLANAAQPQLRYLIPGSYGFPQVEVKDADSATDGVYKWNDVTLTANTDGEYIMSFVVAESPYETTASDYSYGAASSGTPVSAGTAVPVTKYAAKNGGWMYELEIVYWNVLEHANIDVTLNTSNMTLLVVKHGEGGNEGGGTTGGGEQPGEPTEPGVAFPIVTDSQWNSPTLPTKGDQTVVSLNRGIQIFLNQQIVPNSGNIVVSDGVNSYNFDVTNDEQVFVTQHAGLNPLSIDQVVAASWELDILTIDADDNPVVAWEPGKTYSITIPAGVFKNTAGEEMEGYTLNDWYTVAAAETLDPSATFVPAGYGVVTTSIKMTFGMPVTVPAGTYYLTKNAEDAATGVVATPTVDGNTVTWSFEKPAEAGLYFITNASGSQIDFWLKIGGHTAYEWENIDEDNASALQDAFMNAMWKVEATAAADDCVLVSSTPADGSTVEAPVKEIVLNFNTEMKVLNAHGSIYCPGKTDNFGNVLSYEFTVAVDDTDAKKVVITPTNPLLEGDYAFRTWYQPAFSSIGYYVGDLLNEYVGPVANVGFANTNLSFKVVSGAAAEPKDFELLAVWGDNNDQLTEPAKGVVEQLDRMAFLVKGKWINNEACDGFVALKNAKGNVVKVCEAVANSMSPADAEGSESNTVITVAFVADEEEGEDNMGMVDTPVTFPGTYSIYIPEGYFQTTDGVLNNAYAFENWYTIEGNPYTTDPADNSTVAVLSGFEVAFPDSEIVLNDDFKLEVAIDGEVVDTYGPADVSEWMLNTGTIAIYWYDEDGNAAYLEPGAYTITIPANSFKVDGEDWTEPIIVHLNHIGYVETSFTTTPALESNVDALGEIVFKFNKDMKMGEHPEYADLSFMDKNWNSIPAGYEFNAENPTVLKVWPVDESGNKIEITDKGVWSLNGIDNLVTPADGTFIPFELTESLRWVVGKAATLTFTPANGAVMKHISVVQVELDCNVTPDEDEAPVIRAYPGCPPEDANANGVWDYLMSMVELPAEIIDNHIIRHTYEEPYDVNGYITYSIPWGYYNVDGFLLDPATFWTVNVDKENGVELVSVSSDKGVTVVNANGMVVLRNAKSVDLRTLAPGIYIVNGAKVMVK